MAAVWQELKAELVRETDRIFMDCPDEIKRFHYGIMTHSDAGKHALNQYFGHWVHAYAGYMIYSSDTLDFLRQSARRPGFSLKQLKDMFVSLSSPPYREYTVSMMVKYGGQKSLGGYVQKMIGALDSVRTRSEFLELLGAYQPYVARLYWWFHWYFPWGIGPAVCRRLSVDDVKEIVRLSGMAPGQS